MSINTGTYTKTYMYNVYDKSDYMAVQCLKIYIYRYLHYFL